MYYFKQVKKNKISNLCLLNESSLLSEPSSLKLEQKAHLNSRACQINYNPRGLGKRCINKRNNIIFICTTTSSPGNIKSMYRFSFKNLIQYSFRL